MGLYRAHLTQITSDLVLPAVLHIRPLGALQICSSVCLLSLLGHRNLTKQLFSRNIQIYRYTAYNFYHRPEHTIKCAYNPATNTRNCISIQSLIKGTYAWCMLVASPAKWSFPPTGCVTSGNRVANWLGPNIAKAPVEPWYVIYLFQVAETYLQNFAYLPSYKRANRQPNRIDISCRGHAWQLSPQ